MEIYFVITIDVEPDCSPTWHYSNPLTFNGVYSGIGNVLQPFFNKLGAKPTYLINNVVLEDNNSIDLFKRLGGSFELGTHLHPEFIEPRKQIFDYAGKKGEANCCFYEPEIEFQKLKNITELFRQRFKYDPTAFRAGRFSAGINTMNALRSLKYCVDTSVTPHINWCDKTREQPVDYSKAMENPYWVKRGSYLEASANENTLLEVPVTIDLQRRWFRKQQAKWLRPVYSSSNDFKKIIDNYISRYQNNKSIVLNMMFHNVEVLPGLSPYVQNSREAKQFLDQIQFFISYVSKLGGKSVGLSDLFQILKG